MSVSAVPQPAVSPEFIEQFRPRMMSVAYRMLGSVVDAEDAVQDAFVRLQTAHGVVSPEGFLIKTTTRRCIDQLRSARRRQDYVGPWVPEPVDTSASVPKQDLEESLSQGFLLLLERLTPRERAAFVLRQVFAYEYAEIADVLEATEAHVRKMVSRAKGHLADGVPRFRPTPERALALAEQFLAACRAGDVRQVERMLTDDVEVHSDGGGKVTAARVVVRTPALVARFLTGVFHKKRRSFEMRPAVVNGDPGAMFLKEGKVQQVVSLHIEEGVARVYMSLNPDKLSRWSVAQID